MRVDGATSHSKEGPRSEIRVEPDLGNSGICSVRRCALRRVAAMGRPRVAQEVLPIKSILQAPENVNLRISRVEDAGKLKIESTVGRAALAIDLGKIIDSAILRQRSRQGKRGVGSAGRVFVASAYFITARRTPGGGGVGHNGVVEVAWAVHAVRAGIKSACIGDISLKN